MLRILLLETNSIPAKVFRNRITEMGNWETFPGVNCTVPYSRSNHGPLRSQVVLPRSQVFPLDRSRSSKPLDSRGKSHRNPFPFSLPAEISWRYCFLLHGTKVRILFLFPSLFSRNFLPPQFFFFWTVNYRLGSRLFKGRIGQIKLTETGPDIPITFSGWVSFFPLFFSFSTTNFGTFIRSAMEKTTFNSGDNDTPTSMQEH